ncbi:hypothetical protein VCHENC02_0837A, partial [Vibrio harveyi]
MILSVK